ncbi:MAG: acyl carrier protein [Lachnospiraceae bacterium]|nr:acyl carrier protein [Lachnospiraceae bacterium]
MELEKLCSIIAEALNIDVKEIGEDTAFVDDLGANSLDMFEILVGVEEEFDIELDSEAADRIVSVGDAAEEIKKAME